MTASDIFSKEDLEQIKEHGLSLEAVLRQLEQLNRPTPYLHLVRPCKIGDGIEKINPQDQQRYIEYFEQEVQKGRFLKFVPASGAATRMFRVLQRYYNKGEEISVEALSAQAAQGEKEAAEFFQFFNGLKKFAFYPNLAEVMHKRGYDIEALYDKGKYINILRFILTDEGLQYGNMPKALILFHRYNGEARTAFEEHLVEAAHYVTDTKGRAPLHLTVADEHLERFRSFLKGVRATYENRFRVAYDISFSLQKKSTDTIAVDMDNRPFRLPDGSLLFRPGGHGALIENLNDLGGDLIFIKNIDNVAPDHLKPETYKWKKILAGLLVTLQNRIHGYLRILHNGVITEKKETEIVGFMKETLALSLPEGVEHWSPEKKRDFFMSALDRPIRVCGMVRNVGEPGGGPFWVRDKSGQISKQIVEVAQIDPESEDQQAILRASTHFNPVDLVCGVRDWQGKPFDLRNFVDHDAVFISQKSKDGKDLRALELPGLWNGAMAKWITIFVEVPLITFNPVKTVNALLRAEHQPV